MQKALVHIRCNVGKVRRERRDGRDVLIVPSYTLPSDCVMNGIRYPHDEIEKAYKTFERTPAPLGHPTLNGKFVSASDPEGLARGWAASWNENVRREGKRIAIDKVIDIEQAKQLEAGRTILSAVEQGDEIHSSTGLVCMLKEVKGDPEAKFEAHDIVGDHDAWLIGEEGAATPEQGVGILVNTSNPDGEQIEVINSVLDDELERDLNWAADSALRAVERQQRAPLLERIKDAIRQAVLGDTAPGEVTNNEDQSMDKAQFDELSGKVDTLVNSLSGFDERVAKAFADAVKPMTDQITANAEAQKVKDAAEKEKLVNTIVKAGLLDEETAKAADIAVLNALAEKAKPGKATMLNGAFNPNPNADEWDGYDMNAGFGDGKGKEAH